MSAGLNQARRLALLAALGAACAAGGCAGAAAGAPGTAAGAPGTAAGAPGTAADERAEVARLLDAWHAAAARADERAYFDALSERSVFLGTDAKERWDKAAFRRYAHPYFARGKAWKFWAVRRHVSLAPGGRLAWFDEDLGTERLGPARGSGVLVREAGGWRIVQYNLSIPIPNERFDAVRKLIAR